MENIIWDRALLMAIFLTHLFIGSLFATVCSSYVSFKALKRCFYSEIIIVIGIIIYSCITTPIRDEILLAIIGYAFVFISIISTYVLMLRCIVVRDKVYEMASLKAVTYKESTIGVKAVSGIINEHGIIFTTVLLDEKTHDDVLSGDLASLNVKFKYFSRPIDNLIFVEKC